MIRIRIKADQNRPRQTCKKACKASPSLSDWSNHSLCPNNSLFGQIVSNDISIFDGLVLDDQKDGNDQKHAIITKEKPNKITCQSGQCNRNNGSFWCWEWSMINCYRLEIGFVLKLLFPKFVYTDKWKDETCLLLVWIKPWLKEIGIIASTPWNAG